MSTEILYRVIFAVSVLLLAAIRLAYHSKSGQSHRQHKNSHEARSLKILRMITGIPGILVVATWLIDPAIVGWSILPLPIVLRLAGAGLIPLALGLLWWVHHELDKNFSPDLQLADQHTLVTSGPYAFVRHPMYTALLLTGIGFFLLSANAVIGLVSIPGMLLATLLRLPQEETMMIEAFGTDYERYRRRTGVLLPDLNYLLSGIKHKAMDVKR